MKRQFFQAICKYIFWLFFNVVLESRFVVTVFYSRSCLRIQIREDRTMFYGKVHKRTREKGRGGGGGFAISFISVPKCLDTVRATLSRAFRPLSSFPAPSSIVVGWW